MTVALTPGKGPASTPQDTVWGATSLRKALRRFESLVAVALAASALVLLEAYLTDVHIFPGSVPSGALGFAEWQLSAWAFGLQIALGIALAGLIVAGIILAITAVAPWRRGVLAMCTAAAEYGPDQAAAALRARQDHRRTLWLFLAYLLAAIIAGAAFAGANWALGVLGRPALPSTVLALTSGLATGSVLVAIYYYGGRHLAGLLSWLSSPAGRHDLSRGRSLLTAGAVVGLGAALTSLSFGFDALAVASLATILLGARDLRHAYDLWLAGKRAPQTVVRRLPSPV